MQTVTFPMKVMRFSAIWNTSTPHKKCSGAGYKSTNYKDYPTDLVGSDSGADWFYAPCDIVCLRVYSKASHGLWFRSKDKVKMPVGEGYLFFMAEHESVSGFKVNKTYKKGTKLFKEGKAGNATGNHIHLSCGWAKDLSKVSFGTGWTKNNHGAWVLHIKGVTNIKIEQTFFLDKSFTTSIKDKRIAFKAEPKESTTYKLLEDMNIRISPSGDAPLVSVNKWSTDAKKHEHNGMLRKGTKVTRKGAVIKKESGSQWIHTPSGYICKCSANGKVYLKAVD